MLGASAKDIMTRNVVTIKRGASTEEALRLMAEHHVSGLPVVDQDGCVEGMITESDVLLRGQSPASPRTRGFSSRRTVPDDEVQEMYRRSRACRVEDAMTRKVITFGEDSAVADIARVMIENNINRVPILRDCRVVGIVSRGDIVKAMAALVAGPNPTPSRKRRREPIELT